jgi:putative membrane protein
MKRLHWEEALGVVLLSIMAALLGIDVVLYWSDVRGAAFRLIPLFGALGGVAHATYLLGRRTAFAFFVAAVVLGWTAEQIGVTTGLVFGPYHYTDVLGHKLGAVPLLIPVIWFMVVYLSYVLSNLIAGDGPAGHYHHISHAVWLSVLGALIATAYDLTLDPYMSQEPIRAWVWDAGGPYYGIPAQNFRGWIAVAFVIQLLMRLIHRHTGNLALGQAKNHYIAGLPIVFYAILWVSNSISFLPSLQMVSLIAMGIPTVAAGAVWWRHFHIVED